MNGFYAKGFHVTALVGLYKRFPACALIMSLIAPQHEHTSARPRSFSKQQQAATEVEAAAALRGLESPCAQHRRPRRATGPRATTSSTTTTTTITTHRRHRRRIKHTAAAPSARQAAQHNTKHPTHNHKHTHERGTSNTLSPERCVKFTAHQDVSDGVWTMNSCASYACRHRVS